MNAWTRGMLAFLLGCLGVALAFWGVFQELRMHHILAVLAVPLGLTLLLGAFRVSPQTE